MPVNSFKDYPMSFRPEKSQLRTPITRSLADLLEREIRAGNLAPGTKLPPQRELADYLDISLSTVTRAYTICEQRGLLYAVTGRGTFVAQYNSVPDLSASTPSNTQIVDMGVVLPFPAFNGHIAALVQRLYAETDFQAVFTGRSDEETLLREALVRRGLPMQGRQMISIHGTQNALAVALSALFRPGSRIAADSYTYLNMKKLAPRMHIQLVPVEGDAFGMRPEKLLECCEKQHISGVYLMPACQNPTGIRMPRSRRQALAKVISARNLLLLEDDIYGFLDADPPLSALLPTRAVYLGGLDKLFCSDLHLCLMAVPTHLAEPLCSAIQDIDMAVSPLLPTTIRGLLQSDLCGFLRSEKCRLGTERGQMFDSLFGAASIGEVTSFFRWLELPTHFWEMAGSDFEALAQEAGVRVFHSDRFVVGGSGREEPPHIRIAISAPSTAAEYRLGLSRLYTLLYDSR